MAAPGGGADQLTTRSPTLPIVTFRMQRFPLSPMMRSPSASAARAAGKKKRASVPAPSAKPSKPEPWLAPKYKSPRGTVKKVVIPRSTTVPQPHAVTPPPVIVPETGRALPNLPTISGSGRGGAETFQDRSARCAHQAGVYGPDAGNRNAYIGSCINQ